MNQFSPHKLIYHPEHLARINCGGGCNPIKVHISPSMACNARCKDCWDANVQSPKKMSLLRQGLLVDALVASKVKSVVWTGGGEPLLALEENTVIGLGEAGICQGLITNLINVPDWLWDNLNAFSWIRVSLNALNEADYKEHFGVDKWAEVVANLGELRRLKPPNLTLGVGFVAIDRTFRVDTDSFLKLDSLVRADYYQIRPRHGLSLTPCQLEQLQELKDKHDLPIQVTVEKPLKPYLPCNVHWIAPIIDALGDVYPCCSTLGFEPLRIGNIFKEGASLWASNTRLQQAKQLKTQCPALTDWAKSCVPYSVRTNKFIDEYIHDKPLHWEFA